MKHVIQLDEPARVGMAVFDMNGSMFISPLVENQTNLESVTVLFTTFVVLLKQFEETDPAMVNQFRKALRSMSLEHVCHILNKICESRRNDNAS